MYTILHISDLHRTRGSSISNDELLSSLVADFERSAREVPSVSRPDAIVVSGDLVEGLPLESDTYPEGLKAQYQEAIELLVTLSDELLGGDRSRVVIIPGNHDVDWNCARMAFEIEGHESMDPRSFIRDPDSIFRWSWSNRQIFRLVNSQLYQQRFKYFNDMYKTFYKHAPLAYPVDPERPWNLFNLDNGNILVSAFNSCIINDCFSDLGHISSADLAECHLAIRRVGQQGCLPVAVWHHGVGGPPLASDYIDPATVKLMIDKGFRLGLHGHRHDSTHSPLDLFVSTKETMAVIGAGAFSVGLSVLPHGVNCRYNVIQIDRENRKGQVHVREMNQPNIWGPGQLFESGGQSHVSFDWTPSSFESVDQGRSGGTAIATADEIERLVKSGRLDSARQLLADDVTMPATYKRRLMAKVFREAEAWTDLKHLLEHPENDEELAMYTLAAERSGDFTGVEEVLNASMTSGEISVQLAAGLQQRVSALSKFRR